MQRSVIKELWMTGQGHGLGDWDGHVYTTVCKIARGMLSSAQLSPALCDDPEGGMMSGWEGGPGGRGIYVYISLYIVQTSITL